LTKFFTLFILLSLSIIIGCGITQPIRPIEQGATEVIASLGGPIIPLAGIAIPVPYLNIGAMHGVNPNLTFFGNAHITALLFKDVGVDGGISSQLLPEKGIRPAITLNLRAYFFWDAFRGKTIRLFPTGTLTGSYLVGEHSLLYFGADNLYQLTPSNLFVSPFIGYSFPVSNVTSLQIESKWMAMNHDTRHGVFEGAGSINGKGNIGLFFGLQYNLK
jgi:hypothetical protein